MGRDHLLPNISRLDVTPKKNTDYQHLLDLVKEEVITNFARQNYIDTCSGDRKQEYITQLEQTLNEDSSWVKQAPNGNLGYQHHEKIKDEHFREFVKAYRSVVKTDDPSNDSVITMLYGVEIGKALAEKAAHFKPMIAALHEADFVPFGNNNEYIIKWRFQRSRHALAAVWHMDKHRYSLYADESGEQKSKWTKAGTRSVVTSGCVDPKGEETYDCGTMILNNVPVMTETALNDIKDAFLQKQFSASDKCTDDQSARYYFVTTAFESTTEALTKYIDKGNALEKFEKAGIKISPIPNGVISTHNDHQFHSANISAPEKFERCFFAARARNNTEDFRPDATFEMDDKVVKLMFQFV